MEEDARQPAKSSLAFYSRYTVYWNSSIIYSYLPSPREKERKLWSAGFGCHLSAVYFQQICRHSNTFNWLQHMIFQNSSVSTVNWHGLQNHFSIPSRHSFLYYHDRLQGQTVLLSISTRYLFPVQLEGNMEM